MNSLPFIPFFKTSRYRVQTMIDLSEVKPFERVADLGSGDGRISIEFAKKKALVEGFELDPLLADLSEDLIKKSSLEKNIIIHRKNFWDEDLSRFNIVCIYPMPDIMQALEAKLQNEIKKGTRILLNYYPFPTWEYEKSKDNVYLYLKKYLFTEKKLEK